MKFNLDEIKRKLESNVIPKSLIGVDLNDYRRKVMENLKYEIVSAPAPAVMRPDFVDRLMNQTCAR